MKATTTRTRKAKAIKPYLFGRRLVLSRSERIVWEKDRNYYVNMGYPLEQAENRAWDHYHATRRAAKWAS